MVDATPDAGRSLTEDLRTLALSEPGSIVLALEHVL